MKYPAVYVYKKTSDKGRELRYSLRSLSNLKDWNGEVFIVGHKEDWMQNVTVIDTPKDALPHIDRNHKLRTIITSKQIPDDFIFMNDDFYITEPSKLKPMYHGTLDTKDTGDWAESKRLTAAYLKEKGTLNYDTHTPMLMNKQKLSEVMDIVGDTTLLPRSIYGNLHNVGGVEYQDQKTRTGKLPKAPFVSTTLYIPQLDTLFPQKSRFEL